MKSNGPWFACTYRILHVRCLLLKALGRGCRRRRYCWWGWGSGWWASMCFPIDIKQSSDMEMGGQRKNGFSLRLCLDIGQGLSLPPSIPLSLHPSQSPTAHRRCHQFSISCHHPFFTCSDSPSLAFLFTPHLPRHSPFSLLCLRSFLPSLPHLASLR